MKGKVIISPLLSIGVESIKLHRYAKRKISSKQ